MDLDRTTRLDSRIDPAVELSQLGNDIEQWGERQGEISTGTCIFFLTMISYVLYSIIRLYYDPVDEAVWQCSSRRRWYE